MRRVDHLTDEQLLAECRVETMRGPGPGGQKRNKTSSYVSIRHLPTAVRVVAGESRSQAANKTVALRRLRIRIAITVREPIDGSTLAVPDWFTKATRGRRMISARSPLFAAAVGLVLDALEVNYDAIAPTRELLGLSSRQFMSLIQAESAVFAEIQMRRERRGLHPLRAVD